MSTAGDNSAPPQRTELRTRRRHPPAAAEGAKGPSREQRLRTSAGLDSAKLGLVPLASPFGGRLLGVVRSMYFTKL